MAKVTQPETRGEDQPAVNIEELLAAFRETEKQFNEHLWRLEERVRLLEHNRDQEFEYELNRRLSLGAPLGKISEGCESALSRLRSLSRSR